MSASPASRQSDASPAATRVLAALLEARTGQRLAPSRTWRIDVALKPVAAERGVATVDQLVGALASGTDAALADRIVDALLNQETSFFRDGSVIEAVAQAIGNGGADRPRIWSAGCASGQEPLSLAMAFAEREGVVPEILATDVSASAIARARAGRFNHFEIQRGLPVRRLVRWFEQAGDDWVASEPLRRRITVRRHNLAADPPPGGRFNAILCRNVLFYLAPERRAEVLERFADVLLPGGLLVLGAGETVIGQTDRFVPSRRFRGFYEAVPRAPQPSKVYFAA